MVVRNTALLEQVMQQIKDHPELHDQGLFFSETDCGTAACFGGWACLLSGYRDYGAYDTWQVAQGLLGITHDESWTLFSPSNTRHALELMVKDLINGDELREWQDYQ